MVVTYVSRRLSETSDRYLRPLPMYFHLACPDQTQIYRLELKR